MVFSKYRGGIFENIPEKYGIFVIYRLYYLIFNAYNIYLGRLKDVYKFIISNTLENILICPLVIKI
jgi:hypothetical protein